METTKFSAALEPIRSTIGEIDALVKEAGGHFNEAHLERAAHLIEQLTHVGSDGIEAAMKALVEREPVTRLSPDADAGEDEPHETTTELAEGDLLEVRDGKLLLVNREGVTPRNVGVVGQVSQLGLGAHDHPITRDAVSSIEAGIEAARNKDVKPSPTVQTQETGETEDKPEGGSMIELASSEGDLSTHHTDDGSRQIEPAAASEPTKILGADDGTESAAEKAAAGDAGEGAQFTSAPDADKPGDVAAVQTGAQEHQQEPEPASV